ncbi:MAG: glycosyltransferase family 2 protein, partial [Terriglobia bacterium]
MRAHRDYLYGEVQRDIAARAELRAIMATKTFRLRGKARALLARGDAKVSPNSPSSNVIEHRSYEQWIGHYDNPTAAALQHLNRRLSQLGSRPTFSLLMPVYNPMEEHLREAIQSVLRQTYGGWQLCIADDASTAAYVAPLLEEYSRSDSRICVARRSSRGNISEASNSALNIATGEFVVLLDHDDVIPPHALACLALDLDENPQAGLIYSDEDKVDDSGQRFEPYFKPEWNPELLLGQNYFSHLGAFRRSLVQGVGGFRVGFEGSQDYDLTLRVLERLDPSQVRHIPLVLYHWRSHRGSAASVAAAKPYAREASVRALTEHLERTQAEGRVAWTGGWGERAVQWPLPAPAPDVRVLVRRSPSWDGAQSVHA